MWGGAIDSVITYKGNAGDVVMWKYCTERNALGKIRTYGRAGT